MEKTSFFQKLCECYPCIIMLIAILGMYFCFNITNDSKCIKWYYNDKCQCSILIIDNDTQIIILSKDNQTCGTCLSGVDDCSYPIDCNYNKDTKKCSFDHGRCIKYEESLTFKILFFITAGIVILHIIIVIIINCIICQRGEVKYDEIN